jgi:ABC-type oligopeptide transport system substrate-binding subunit
MEEGENLRFKKAILLLLVVLLSCGLLLGCDSEKEVQSEKDKVPQELVIGIGRDFYEGPETANFLHGSTGVWEGLTYPGDDLEPVMQLATKLTPDDTNKVWMVTLRDGVKFHDDSPLNADAVVKSVMRLKNTPKLDGYGTFLTLDKVEAVDDKTVKFTFNRPEPAFPAKVAYHGCPIFSPKSFNEEGKVTHPYGTGPFKFEDYKKGEELVITRNDNYWGKKAKLEKVTFKTVSDPSTRLAALTTGEIQAIVDVGGVLPEQASTIKEDKNLVLLTKPVTTSHYIIFNNKKEPFKDKNLRKAVSLSLDRVQLVDKVLSGYGEPADTIYTPQAEKWAEKGLWKTDKAKAKELAAKYVKNVKFDKKTGEILQVKDHLVFDAAKVAEEEKYDGYYAIVTSELDMSDTEVIDTYRGLWQIEETFRVTKGVLETRPVYVSLEDHINAHFLTCFLALTILRIMQKKTGRLFSAERIVECLNKISCSNEQDNVYLFDYRSVISDAIGQALGIDFTNKRLTLGAIKKVLAQVKK